MKSPLEYNDIYIEVIIMNFQAIPIGKVNGKERFARRLEPRIPPAGSGRSIDIRKNVEGDNLAWIGVLFEEKALDPVKLEIYPDQIRRIVNSDELMAKLKRHGLQFRNDPYGRTVESIEAMNAIIGHLALPTEENFKPIYCRHGDLHDYDAALAALLNGETGLWKKGENGLRGTFQRTRFDLSGSVLTHRDLGYLDLSFIDFTKADLTGSYLEGIICRSSMFYGAVLREALLQNAEFNEKCRFWDADMTRADLRKARFKGEIEMKWVLLDGARMVSASLEKADLSHASLVRANLFKADLSFAHLENADLEKALLIETDLSTANLTLANLSLANLLGAEITTSTIFNGAKLNGTTIPTSCKPFLLPFVLTNGSIDWQL